MQVRTHYLKLFHRMNYIFRESILLIYRLIKNKVSSINSIYPLVSDSRTL